jgi:hypothetical protein
MTMNLTTTIKLANGATKTFNVDFSALPVSSQEAIAAYGFARKINDTANSAAARVKDTGGDDAAMSKAKEEAALAAFTAMEKGTMGTTQRGPRVDEWQAEARAYVAKLGKMPATLKGVEKTADRNRILDAAIVKNKDKLQPIIDAIVAAKSTATDTAFDL